MAQSDKVTKWHRKLCHFAIFSKSGRITKVLTNYETRIHNPQPEINPFSTTTSGGKLYNYWTSSNKPRGRTRVKCEVLTVDLAIVLFRPIKLIQWHSLLAEAVPQVGTTRTSCHTSFLRDSVCRLRLRYKSHRRDCANAVCRWTVLLYCATLSASSRPLGKSHLPWWQMQYK